MTRRLAVARFWFQGNAFSPLPTTLASFHQREWTAGRAALDAARGTDTELGAVADFAMAHSDWDVTVLRCASALPGGALEETAFAAILEEIVAGVAATRWDGVYLSLHGAAITTERLTPELDLVRAIRAAVGRTPIAASFDLRANMNTDMTALLDHASASRTCPSTDLRATAERVLLRLDALATGESNVEGTPPRRGRIAQTDMLLPGYDTLAGPSPMADVLAEAVAAASEHPLDVSVLGGFPHADTRDCSASVMVYPTDASQSDSARWAARNAAVRVATAMLERRQAFRPALPGANQALREAVRAPAGLVAVTECADDPLSGGCADTPGLFRALLDLAPTEPSVFAFFADAEAVAQCARAGIGGSVQLELGAKTSRDFGARVPVTARVLRLTDGRFRNRGPLEFGTHVDAGQTAVVDVAGIQVILTSLCRPAIDPAFYALHGIDLDTTRLLCVKARSHLRVAFEGLCTRIIDCDSPGPATVDLANLPFRNQRLR